MTRPPNQDEKLVVGGQELISGIPLNAKKWRDMSDIAVGRPGTVEDAAGVMLFLASPLSGYVTGTCIECTGGRYM
jgi:3-oxoacyl-[acyl-carrier protein] reductase